MTCQQDWKQESREATVGAEAPTSLQKSRSPFEKNNSLKPYMSFGLLCVIVFIHPGKYIRPTYREEIDAKGPMIVLDGNRCCEKGLQKVHQVELFVH
jgi:hypothetical protein